MALNFAKKAAPPKEEAETGSAPPAKEQQAKPAFSWAKRGQSAKAAVALEEKKAEERRAEQGKLWRFYLGEGEEAQVTFLDGKLDADGMLDIPRFYEHRIFMSGDWHNYVCTADIDQTQPCPICERGDKSSLVGVMTVLDHRAYTVKKGPNAGKIIKNSRKLFVAKPHTITLLTKLAVKRGGLAGCTFDVSRSGDKSAAVGDVFDFVHKYGSLSEIAGKFDLKLEDVQPAVTEEEIRYRSPEELIELGVGKAHIGVGFEQKGSSGSKSKLADEL